MLKTYRHLIIWTVTLWLINSATSFAQPLPLEKVPTPLQPWVDWVLFEQPSFNCPLYYNQNLSICRWPSQLNLQLDASKAEFQQTWTLHKPDWVTLPGDLTNWPQEVQVNAAPALVMERQGLPQIYLPIGQINLSGQFYWEKRPEYLQLPIDSGLINLTLDDNPVTLPEIDEQGRLWLRAGGQAAPAATEENRLELKVYRHLLDNIPLQITTQITLEVAGRHREVILGPVLLDQQIPMELTSPLPARLEADGRLRVQVRPGSWTLTLKARHPHPVSQLTLPEHHSEHWVPQEIWVFQAQSALRTVEITGIPAIDPQQTTLPANWRSWPTYLVNVGSTLTLVEKRRGDPEPMPDQLHLERHFWLDFDGQGYSVQDHIRGTMTKDWRLNMAAPASLGRVNIHGQDQFITYAPQSSHQGVEVRLGDLDLIADSRLEEALYQVPAVGWLYDFQSVNAALHLPPGWRLFNASGVDSIPQTWLSQWTLLDLFIVLIIATAIGKLWHWRWGFLALLTLTLIYHETDAPRWVWFHLIIALALLRVLPTLNWFNWLARSYRNLSLITLLIIAVPFMVQQARQSLYPQLENPDMLLESPDFSPAEAGLLSGAASPSLRPVMSPPETPQPQTEEAFDDTDSQNVMQKEKGYSEDYRAKKRAFYQGSLSMGYMEEEKSSLLQIDPNTQVQTGPGLPQWDWRQINLNWHGPVAAEQTIQLWLISPQVNQVLGVLRILLLGLLTGFFLLVVWQPQHRLAKGSLFQKPTPNSLANLMGLGLLTFLLVTQNFASPVHAQVITETTTEQAVSADELPLEPPESQPAQTEGTETPSNLIPEQSIDQQTISKVPDANNLLPTQIPDYTFPPDHLLETLKQRLLIPADCLPSCANISQMQLDLEPDYLRIRLEIHAQTHVGLPLPGTAKHWLAQRVWLGEQAAQNIFRDPQGQLWLNLPAGIHQVLLEGPLPNRNTLQLPLPLKPRLVKFKSKGWQVEGIHENGLADQQLQFTREQSEETRALLEIGNLPPFVKIERTLLLGLDWQVHTTLKRLTPLGSAIVLEIPLLTGESVTTEKIRVSSGKALINLSPEESEVSWTSTFSKRDTIELIATESPASIEVWRLEVSAIWHVEIAGIPIIHHQSSGRWLPEWRPWPGEKVSLKLTRPQGVTGQIVTIDRTELLVTPGQRTTDSRLTLSLRSSQGGQHQLTLPEQAELQKISINDQTHPIRQEGQKVTFPITPGLQKVELTFRQSSSGLTSHFETPTVDLGLPSVNTRIEVSLPPDRWILWVGGNLMGPAVLIWGVLIIIALAALGLGQIKTTPLKFRHWLLLGIVLTQVHIVGILIVVGWFILMGQRAQLSPETPPTEFAIIQISLALFTLIALSTLLMAIHQGLLGHPQMHIAGNGSSAHLLRWYEDRTTGQLPTVWIFSWSVWIYRLAMLIWALWISLALMRWLPWAWNCFSTHGLWKGWRSPIAK